MDYIKATMSQIANATTVETEEIGKKEAEKPEIKAYRMQKPDEVKEYLRTRTMAVMERLHDIAMDSLYSRDESGQRYKVAVPPASQLQAAMAFLDRSMGKPQVNLDLTSGQRPILFGEIYNTPPLIQGTIGQIEDATNEPLEQGDDKSIQDIEL